MNELRVDDSEMRRRGQPALQPKDRHVQLSIRTLPSLILLEYKLILLNDVTNRK